MPLTTVDTAPASQRSHQEQVSAAVKELQGLKVVVVTGGAAAAQLNCAGIVAADVILSVLRFDVNAGSVVALTDITGSASIPAAGKIAIAVIDTTGDTLLALFYHKP